MKNLLLLLSFIILHVSAFAQETEQEFETDRPSKTIASSLVPAGHFQLETGLQFEKYDYAYAEGRTWLYPQALVRIGVFPIAELRLEATFKKEQTWYEDDFLAYQRKGLSTVRIGTKVNVLQEAGIVPELSVLVMLELPLGKEAYKPKKVAPELMLLFSNSLTDRLKLQYNVGYRKEPQYGEMEEKVQYSTTLSGRLTDRITLFGEYFGERTNTSFENNIDGGLQFLVLSNLQVDALIGTDVASEFSNWFVGGGLSLRLPR